MKTLFAAAAVTAFSALGAHAADIAARPYLKAPAAAVSSWTGFYAGLNVGYGFNDRTANFAANDPASVSLAGPTGIFPSAGFDTNGILGGVQAGYNWQTSPNWLLGIEADFQGSNIKGDGSAQFVSTVGASPYLLNAQQNVEWFGTLRARVGWLPNNNLLVFATGGLAYGSVKSNLDVIRHTPAGDGVSTGGFSYDCTAAPIGASCLTGQSSEVRVGYTVGGGLEYSLWQNVTVKAEYLYVNLGNGDLNATALRVLNIGDTPSTVRARLGDTDFHVVRTGLNFRF